MEETPPTLKEYKNSSTGGNIHSQEHCLVVMNLLRPGFHYHITLIGSKKFRHS